MIFVAFEGIDGSGKGTIASNVFNRLNNTKYRTHLASASDHELSKLAKFGGLNTITEHTDVYLFWAARRAMMVQMFQEKENFDIYMIDRYFDSTFVFRNEILCSLPMMLQYNYCTDIFPYPDITFIMDVSAEESIRRTEYENDRFRSSSVDIVNKRRDLYLSLLTIFPDRKFAVIDTEINNPEQCSDICIDYIFELLR